MKTTLTHENIENIIKENPQIVENADLYSRTILEQYEYEQRVSAACDYKNSMESNANKIGLNGGRKVLYIIQEATDIDTLQKISFKCHDYFTKKVLTTIIETQKFTEKQIDIVIDYLIENEDACNIIDCPA
tara:strand:- start:235 stop:627 length:393 start_codon:yes stop_codon:yes gene_type:complete